MAEAARNCRAQTRRKGALESRENPATANFVALLQKEFAQRCRSNPQYSMRAFARNLGIDQSLLSKIFQGKRSPTRSCIFKVGHRLGIQEKELKGYLSSADNGDKYRQISLDAFNVISDWYHFAILELVKAEDGKLNPETIARRLEIPRHEAEEALARLERLEFIRVRDGKVDLLAPNNSWVDYGCASYARKSLQRQLFHKAHTAIDQVRFELRDVSSLTVACDKSLLPAVSKRIHAFRRKLDQFITEHGKLDEVYQLVIAFYPLTVIREKIDESRS